MIKLRGGLLVSIQCSKKLSPTLVRNINCQGCKQLSAVGNGLRTREVVMAAASFLVPSLSGWSSKPNRIRHSPRVNLRRRQRITPPWSIEEIEERLKVDKELEVIQERHIRRKIREYLRPFRLFLTAIGRFPYSVTENDSGLHNIVVQAVKKASCAPIIELGTIQEEIEDSKESKGQTYKYDPWSIRGFMFFVTTFFAVVTMILATIGYIDLSLTVHRFQDIIEKEINGELTCNKTKMFSGADDTLVFRRNTRNAMFLPFMKNLHEQPAYTWNCTYAVKMLSSCFSSVVNFSTNTQGKIGFFRVRSRAHTETTCQSFKHFKDNQ